MRVRFTKRRSLECEIFDGKVNRKQDDFLNAVFATDPITGYPVNDIELVLNNKTRPEVAEYVRSRLMQVIPANAKTTSEDADALAFEPHETLDQYKQKVRDYVRNLKVESELSLKNN